MLFVLFLVLLMASNVQAQGANFGNTEADFPGYKVNLICLIRPICPFVQFDI